MLADCLLVLRRLRNAPGFTFASIAMLALGIAFSVAMFCTLNGVLLRGLPFPHGERMLMLQAANPAQNIAHARITAAEARQLAQGTAGFDALSYFEYWSDTVVQGDQRPRDVTANKVSAGFFATLGMKALIGRTPDADDIRMERPLAVISYREWQRSFGGDPGVIGQRLERAGEAPLEIIGVMPASMSVLFGDTALWRALPERELPQDDKGRLNQRYLSMLGRLHEGVSLPQAEAALAAGSAALREQHGSVDSGWRISATPVLDVLVGDSRTALWSAFALAVLVLLIAAANVAILLDGRQAARRREQAVMQALGAAHGRVLRALILELSLIAVAAAVLGIAFAHLGIGALRELAAGSIPRIDGIVMDWRVAACAVLLALATPALAALAGAVRVHGEPIDAIRGGGRGLVGERNRRRLLPAAAMALSTLSLVAALSLGAGLWRLQHVDPGYTSDAVHVLQIFRSGNAADDLSFAERMQETLSALPGVRRVALTSLAPLSNLGPAGTDMQVVGRTDSEPMQMGFRRVSAGYRAALDIPLREGRDFTADDRAGTEPVAIINRSAAQRVFADASPLGAQISLPQRGGERVICRIVGVVEDIRNDGLRQPPAPEILVPFAQQPGVAMSFLVRGEAGLGGLDVQIDDALRTLDPRQAITRQYVLADDLAEELRPARFFARTVGAFAFAALLLAVLGAYAVASLQQRRRVGEFGLRLAIGAAPRRLALNVLGDSCRVSAAGIACGLIVAAIALRLIDTQALGIDTPMQQLAIGCGLLAMSLAAVVASVLPALRAARIDPIVALRNE
jgi:putative ABC transport system permease protein